MTKKWIQGAIQHPGALTAKAKAAGESVSQFATGALRSQSQASPETKKQANLYRTLRSFNRG